MSGPADLPAEARKAAAKVIYDDNNVACGDYEAAAWDELPDDDQGDWLVLAERVLAAALPSIRAHESDPMVGFSMWLDRESWGVIIDALIEHRASATKRKAANSASTSDVRADMCADLIRQLNERSAARVARGGDQHD